MAATVEVDPDSGEFVKDADGKISLLPGGVFVRWDDVEQLEFIDA